MRVGSPAEVIQILKIFWSLVTTGVILTLSISFGLQFLRGAETTFFNQLPAPEWLEFRGNPELFPFLDSSQIRTVDSIPMVVGAGILTIPVALLTQYSLMSVATGSMLAGYHVFGQVPDVQLVLEVMIAISMIIAISVFYKIQEIFCMVRSGWHRNL
ncbi:hypothetical protein [Halosimplex halobium]|uniref:hypothetical protein n=1 Tax=Halosimplex halobium TaxID=3396618 RepID=UPI003F544B2B